MKTLRVLEFIYFYFLVCDWLGRAELSRASSMPRSYHFSFFCHLSQNNRLTKFSILILERILCPEMGFLLFIYLFGAGETELSYLL